MLCSSSIRETKAGRGALSVVVLLLTATATAQTTTTTPPSEQAQPAEGQPPPATEAPPPEPIDVTEGTGFRYEARGRRDPFISLALGIDVLSPDVRPPGLAGMLIQEVSLRGIVKTVDGYIAMIQGTDNKSYFARHGERLYDGNIQSIDDARVVFRQEINDPLRIEKFQTVEKTLHPVEEGKR